MRALSIPDSWSADDLYRRYTHAPTVAIGRRYHALYLRRLGHPPGAVAALLGVSTQAIREWVAFARSRSRPPGAACGRQRPATEAHRRPAGSRHRLGGCRTEADAQAAPGTHRHRWGISLSTTQIWHLLKRHDARRVVPRTRHYQADVAAQRRFKKSAAADAPGAQGAVSAALPR